MCWRCAHLATHHGSTIEAPLAGCTCDQSEIYPAAAVPHIPFLLTVARRMTRSPDAAQDLVQDALVRAIAAWLSYRPGSSLKTWLTVVMQNAFINAYNKKRRHERFASERPIDVFNALHTEPVTMSVADIGAALDTLPSKLRAVLIAADVHGMRYRDIARDMQMPLGSVMSSLFRARKALEAPLADIAADYGIRIRRRVSK